MRMKYAFLILLGLGCSEEHKINTVETLSSIIKGSVISGAAGELSPIVFNNSLYFVSFGRSSIDLSQGFVKIQNQNLSTFSTFPFPYAYGCAYVENGTVHLFASSESNPGNSIVTVSSTDLITWTAPQVIFTAPSNQTMYNTSAAKTDAGYVISYEIHEENYASAWFYQKFLTSTDLVTWISIGGHYEHGLDASCPMIRFVNGYYYLFNAHDNGPGTVGPRYIMWVTRSKDLINFEDSLIPVLVPKADGSEGNDNADMDSIEFNGRLIIVYGVGDQTTWGLMKQAYYSGTIEEFVQQFY